MASTCFSPVICLILPQAVDYLGSFTMLTCSWRSVYVPAGLRSRAHPGASQALMVSVRPPCPGAPARALLGFRGGGGLWRWGCCAEGTPVLDGGGRSSHLACGPAAAGWTALPRAPPPEKLPCALIPLRSAVSALPDRVLYVLGVRVLPCTLNTSPLCGCLCILLMTF